MVGQRAAYRGNHSIDARVGKRQTENMAAHKARRSHKKKLHVTGTPESRISRIKLPPACRRRDLPRAKGAIERTRTLSNATSTRVRRRPRCRTLCQWPVLRSAGHLRAHSTARQFGADINPQFVTTQGVLRLWAWPE